MSYREQSWYHGPIDRIQAESVLHGRKAGLFLVRDSSTHPGDFVLSVSENGKVSHYIISHRNNLYLIGDQSFPDLPSVLDFYRMHFLDTTTLIEIAPRQPMGGLQQYPSSSIPSPGPGSANLPPPVMVSGELVVRGKFDFKSDDPEDLNFKKGDIMKVLRKDEEDWWYARHSDGRCGSIPVPYIEIVPAQQGSATPDSQVLAKATMERQCPFDPSALSFKQGEIIIVTKRNDNGIWEGEINGRKGHFPFTSVELISS